MEHTDFLMATPGLITGFARTLDIGATLKDHSYNISATPGEADTWAMASDWHIVGNDLRHAIAEYSNTVTR
jgi:hypothetical protein